jgi:hypothetical protein
MTRSPGAAEYLLAKHTIEPMMLEDVRGRSFNECLIIFDEAQNSLPENVKTVISRVGENSKVVITGDTKQIDLDVFRHDSGLLDSYHRLANIAGVGRVQFSKSDIVRNGIDGFAATTGPLDLTWENVELVLAQWLFDHFRDGFLVFHKVALEYLVSFRLLNRHPISDFRIARSRRMAIANRADARWATVRLQFAALKLLKKGVNAHLAHFHGYWPFSKRVTRLSKAAMSWAISKRIAALA